MSSSRPSSSSSRRCLLYCETGFSFQRHLSPLPVVFTRGLIFILMYLQSHWILIFTFLTDDINWSGERGSSSCSNCINLRMDSVKPHGQKVATSPHRNESGIHINYTMISNTKKTCLFLIFLRPLEFSYTYSTTSDLTCKANTMLFLS